MTLAEYSCPSAFLAVAEESLLRKEAVHGLMLGICRVLIKDPLRYGSPPFLATVERNAALEVAALMTPPHKLQLCAEEDCDTEALRAMVHALREGGWPVSAVLASPPLANRFALMWCEQTGARSHTGMCQRIHQLRTVIPPPPVPGAMVQAVETDIPLATQWVAAFHDDAMHEAEPPPRDGTAQAMVEEGRLFFWDDHGRTSMAARTRPTPHGESIGAVYTPPEYRRNGYASAVVAGLSQRLLDDGKQFCTLFTDLSNPTSNHIYHEIGYAPVADLVDIHFQ